MKEFQDLENLYNKHLHLKYEPNFLTIVMGVILGNRFDSEPVWLQIIAPPSSGKTRILTPLQNSHEVIMKDQLTPRSLISHAKKKDTHDGEEPSLLPKLDGKILIIKDGTTFEAMPAQYRGQIFAQLRAAFDGGLDDSSGLGEKSFKAKFGMIIATTPATERWKTLESSLGQRFLYYRPYVTDIDDYELWNKVMGQSNRETMIRNELGNATVDFLINLKTPDKVLAPHELIDYAQMIAHLRMSFIRDTRSGKIDYPPEREMSFRVAKQLCSLYTALYYLTGSQKRSMHIIRRITRDSAPYTRKKVMDALMKTDGSIPAMTAHAKVSQAHIYRIIQELQISNILCQNGKDSPDHYALRPEYKTLYHIVPRRKTS